MPTGFSGLFKNTYGARVHRGEIKRGEIGNKTFSEIQDEAYNQGYSQGYDDGYRDGQKDTRKHRELEDDGK